MSGCCCSGDPNYEYNTDYAKCSNVCQSKNAWPPNPVRVFKDDVNRLYSTRSIWRCGAWYWSWPPLGAGPQLYNVTPLPNRDRQQFESSFTYGQLGSAPPY